VRRTGAALAAAVVAAVTLIAATVVLAQPGPRLTATDNVRLLGYPLILQPGQQACQQTERVPAGTTTLALMVAPLRPTGPPLELTVLGRGVSAPGGYRDGDELRVRLPEGLSGAGEVCLGNSGPGAVGIGGQDASMAIPPGIGLTVDGTPQPLAMQLRWERGTGSAFSQLGDVLRRWGYVTAFGSLTPYLAILLFAGAFAGAITVAVRGRGTALACAAVAFAATAGWALTTPVFHVPDEPQHFAYLERLASSGQVPKPVPGPVFSDSESIVFAAVQFNQVAGNRLAGRPPWSADVNRQIEAALARDPSRAAGGGQTNTTNNPPLYYVAQLGPYFAATALGGDVLDRILAVRLASALLIALTAGFVFAFLRELLPRSPWLWPVGALAVAVQPLLGFIGGGVNNDAGMFAASAAVFWLVARALRHGLDRRGAVGIGLAFGLGLITKATIVGLAPGLVVCAAVLLVRAAPELRAALLRRIGLAAAVLAVPVLAYLVINNVVWDRGLWSGGGAVATSTPGGRPAQLLEFMSYLWQFYLPRLPFMTELQAGLPLYNVWLKGFVARYGWLDTTWPGGPYAVAAGIFGAVVALAGVALWRARSVLASRRGELLVYAALAAGFLLVVGWAGYRGRIDNGYVFEQARYLLPLLALYGAVIALAARGAGRWGRAAGAALVTLACSHALFSVLLVAGRFYA
jgi:hypothetical protein